MADAPLVTEKEVFEATGYGLVNLLTLIASNSGEPSPVLGAMALAGPLLGLGFSRFMHRAATRRFPKFATGFLSAFDPDPVKAEEKAKEATNHPPSEDLDELMMRSFRLMLDAVDPNVVPILGYMAGRYTFEGRKADTLFRGLGRVLCEVEPDELEALKLIIRSACLQLQHVEMITLNIDRDFAVWSSIAGAESRSVSGRIPAAARVFALLKRETLATNATSDGPRYDGIGQEPLEVSMLIGPQVASAIRDIIEPFGPT